MNKPIICPSCGSNDAVQKVSSIVSGGTVKGSYSGPSSHVTSVGDKTASGIGFSTMSGVAKSELASLLSSPVEPPKEKYSGCRDAVLWLGAVIAPVLIFGLMGGENQAGVFLGGFLSIGVGIYYFYSSNKYKKEVYPILLEVHNKAMERWNRSYYCHRDDIVFDPVNDEISNPNNLFGYYYPDFEKPK